MSTKYTGGFITKSPVAPTTSAASGIWTLDQQQQAQKAGTWPSPPIFIEDLFSTYLYTGNGSTQTITNGIDLAGKGGLVWSKSRSNALSHFLCDTVRGRAFYLYSDATVAQQGPSAADRDITSFNANGYSLGPNSNADINTNAATFVSWTFREQPKFFDIVTYSGSSSDQTISHNLGSTPGCIMIKKLDSNTFNAGWAVYHRSLANPNNNYLVLNTTAATANYGAPFISSVSSTTFTVAGNAGSISLAGSTYVAYLWAHDAGGFPVSGGGSTNGISCGSFTTDGSGNASVTLGYEPQWIMAKASSGTVSDWFMYDNMRGLNVSNGSYLRANSTASETAVSPMRINATGFSVAGSTFDASSTYIYIAIRRGPMKTPTVGTSVFDEDLAGNASAPSFTSAFPVDLGFIFRLAGGDSWYWVDRLRGTPSLNSNNNAAEASFPTLGKFDYMNGYGSSTTLTAYTGWNFRRAPGFFDEVCYTGTGAGNNAQIHNLTVAPEILIVKNRSFSESGDWYVFHTFTAVNFKRQFLSTTAAESNTTYGSFLEAQPTTTNFILNSGGGCNASGTTYVAYLFATVAGVSKVGSYTGTAATQTVDCGFTSGARFVLIKRTNASGDWFVWDSVRGIIPGNDPYVKLNTEGAEVTNVDWVDAAATGFEVSNTEANLVNVNGGTYIFLAIA
jgi:hypothetical protein